MGSRSVWTLKTGESGRIKGFDSSLEEGYRQRLIDLGFLGEQVRCLFVTGLGAPRLYQVRCSVYSLDEQIARQIEMEGEGAA